MSEPIKDGGPAFPVSEILAPDGSHERWAEDGMSLRDYFAAKALPGLIAEAASEDGFGSVAVLLQQNGYGDAFNTDAAMAYATAAYKLADAMLKARSA